MDSIFNASAPFESRCKKVLKWQLTQNEIYTVFAATLGISNENISSVYDIPLLPIRAFKESKLTADKNPPEIIFRSSGTGSMDRSTHYVTNPEIYIKAVETGFYKLFPPENYSILAYTPGYNENPDSSLVWMLNHLISRDSSGLSRFLPLNEPVTENHYREIVNNGKKIVLFGAAFGLLDLIEIQSDTLPDGSHIIETGGMKTRRREISKTELRKILSGGFSIPEHAIHSEYGMCELLSQCYAVGGEWFTAPHWVHVSIRQEFNPGKVCQTGETGKIGLIDLANIYSCPFILTEDKGVMDENGRFKVLGRWNNDNLRGCNFLIDSE